MFLSFIRWIGGSCFPLKEVGLGILTLSTFNKAFLVLEVVMEIWG